MSRRLYQDLINSETPILSGHQPNLFKGQRGRILKLLLDAKGEWVPLPEIMALAAQFSARIFELRHQCGYPIENKTERHNGVVHSWFRLVTDSASRNEVRE